MKKIIKSTGSISINNNGFILTNPCVIPATGRRGGGKRGTVKGFSYQSCLRLRKTLLSADYSKPCFGMAITFESSVLPCMILRRHLRVEKDFARLGVDAIIWRLEQTRRGTLHFHLIVWAADEMAARHALCRAYELGGNYYVNISERNCVRGLDDKRSVAYLSAHEAKRKQYQVVHLSGVRPWGVLGRARLPRLPFESLKIDCDKVFYKVVRSYRKFLSANGQTYAKVRFDSGSHCKVLRRLVDFYSRFD